MSTIFRFKLSDELIVCMQHFAAVHTHDDLKTFKESFDTWYTSEVIASLVKKENDNLNQNGYNGDVRQKIFKSIRYYYRKKGTRNKIDDTTPKQERTKSFYLPKEMFEYIDRIIQNQLHTKPSDLFATFLETYQNNPDVQEYIEKDESKVKKAFKNRIFKLQIQSISTK